MANTSKNWTTSIIHVNTGMRNIVIPGLRILMMVTTRLMAPINDAKPVICRPNA